MDSEQSAAHSVHHKNKKYIFFSGKKYFIEVIQCSGEEMNLVLMGVVPSNLLNGKFTEGLMKIIQKALITIIISI